MSGYFPLPAVIIPGMAVHDKQLSALVIKRSAILIAVFVRQASSLFAIILLEKPKPAMAWLQRPIKQSNPSRSLIGRCGKLQRVGQPHLGGLFFYEPEAN
jgi:hypothetical protein